jgi:hypothetical protein
MKYRKGDGPDRHPAEFVEACLDRAWCVCVSVTIITDWVSPSFGITAPNILTRLTFTCCRCFADRCQKYLRLLALPS